MLPAADWDLFALAPDDPAALGALFERHRHYVFRTAWGLLGEHALADDVVQDVFVKMRSGRLKATPKARFTTWLYRVAINTAREHARKRRRTWGDPTAQAELEAMADPGADTARIETLEDVGQALSTLPLRQREVVILRLFEGFDTAETAEILGCRQGTVKAQLHRATTSLKSFLSPPTKQETQDEKTDDRNSADDSHVRSAGHGR